MAQTVSVNGGVRVVSEPLTYRAEVIPTRRGGARVRSDVPWSYCQDLILAERHGNREATERLARHGREMEVELERRGWLAEAPDASYEFEQRAPVASYGAPPLWVIDHFATAPRPHRVLADLAPNFLLPEGAFSVNLPRFTEGTSAGSQSIGGPAPGSDVTDAAVSAPVSTIAGQWDVPIQLVEQSPRGAHFDYAAFTQLTADYDGQLETQLIIGDGVGNHITGILNNTAVPTSHKVTTTQTTATGQFTFLGQVVAQIGNDRDLSPEQWLIRTNRFAWLGSSEDQQQRPLMITDRDGSGNFSLLGIDAEQDNAIPTNLGLTLNQDVIIAVRASDWMIFESDFRTDVMPEPLSGGLEVRLQLRGYVAALLRYPSSVGWLSGAGLVIPAGF